MVRDLITVLPGDESVKLKLGWVIREEIGVVVCNSYSFGNRSDKSNLNERRKYTAKERALIAG